MVADFPARRKHHVCLYPGNVAIPIRDGHFPCSGVFFMAPRRRGTPTMNNDRPVAWYTSYFILRAVGLGTSVNRAEVSRAKQGGPTDTL